MCTFVNAASVTDDAHQQFLAYVDTICEAICAFAVESWLMELPDFVDNWADRLRNYSRAIHNLQAKAAASQCEGKPIDPQEPYYTFLVQLRALRCKGKVSKEDFAWYEL